MANNCPMCDIHNYSTPNPMAAPLEFSIPVVHKRSELILKPGMGIFNPDMGKVKPGSDLHILVGEYPLHLSWNSHNMNEQIAMNPHAYIRFPRR